MGLFNRPTNPTPSQGNSFVELIQNEGNNTGRGIIACRQPSTNFNTHAKLLVRAGEEAIFENGATEWAVFPERTECELQTQNIAIIRSFREALSGGKSFFPCRVYFISTEEFEVPWGTLEPIGFTCPLIGEGALMRGNGIYVVKIVDSERFAIKVLRDNISYTIDDLHDKLFHRVYQDVAAIISEVLEKSGINSMEFSKKKKEIAQQCIPALQTLFDQYGIYLVDFTISLELDEEQRQMFEQSRRLQRMQAQGEAEARVIGAQGKVAEMNTMGSAYTTIKGMEMLQTIAENPGAGGLASAGAGIGMGMAAGTAFNNIAQSVFGGTMQTPVQPQQQTFGGQSRFGGGQPQSINEIQPDPMESLQKMKQLLDAGLITQDVYDNKVAEILSRL